jgi:hypothetical protein
MSGSQAALAGNISTINFVDSSASTSGTVQAGNTVTVNPGTWHGTRPISYTYQWRNNGNNISGEISSSFLLDRTHLGYPIQCLITATNPLGLSNSYQLTVTYALVGAPINIEVPTIDGTAAYGNVLTVTNGTWGGYPISYSYTYQWYNSNVGAISGATASTYTLTASDVGFTVYAIVTANNGVTPNGTAETASTSNVTRAPVNSALPTISGTAVVSNVLTVTNGTWNGYPISYSYTYQWYNSSVGAIGGATSSTYTLTASDVGFTVYAIVTASNGISSSGTAQTASTSTVVSPTYAFGTIPASINEGSDGTFNVNTTYVPDGTTMYWTLGNVTSSDEDLTNTAGSFTITGNTGSFTVRPVADLTSEGSETFRIAIRTTSNTNIDPVATSNLITINDTSIPTPTGQAMFALGGGGGGLGITNVTNLISNAGILSGDVFYSGVTARQFPAAARYGINKAIFAFGGTTSGSSSAGSALNLVSSTGVMAADTYSLNNPTASSGKAGTYYDTDKAIFGFGATTSGTYLQLTNLVSNTGVVAGETANAATSRAYPAAASYGGVNAIFGFGQTPGPVYSAVVTLFNNVGAQTSNTTSSGTTRSMLGACGYGGDKAIFGFGFKNISPFNQSICTRFTNTGVYSSQVSQAGPGSTSRGGVHAGDYGTGLGIFGYGATGSSATAVTTVNRVSNLGDVAAAATGAGSGRQYGAGAGF